MVASPSLYFREPHASFADHRAKRPTPSGTINLPFYATGSLLRRSHENLLRLLPCRPPYQMRREKPLWPRANNIRRITKVHQRRMRAWKLCHQAEYAARSKSWFPSLGLRTVLASACSSTPSNAWILHILRCLSRNHYIVALSLKLLQSSETLHINHRTPSKMANSEFQFIALEKSSRIWILFCLFSRSYLTPYPGPQNRPIQCQ
jgi:hypothetical protein